MTTFTMVPIRRYRCVDGKPACSERNGSAKCIFLRTIYCSYHGFAVVGSEYIGGAWYAMRPVANCPVWDGVDDE